ncbi:glycoside hydrolase [Pseudomassariella vexata]|uniref:lytic cellulose monooxygenase (C4-dehydrogenating) n=1 Tax=Pseudomassariella vexata TaxID=1141098 RepID=A0A1Y2DQZ6_9PEZI|nr:glycoside hydrolase [Pseudomassariella vexata]ORY61691.1 glycoside hydrolase [Pseudomassariella vexata]
MSPVRSIILALTSSGIAASHSFITNVNINLTSYSGFDPRPGFGNNSAQPLAAWSTTATDQGYVNQTAYQSPDIVCHRGAENAQAHIPVSAGDTVHLQWMGWPQSHKGPVMDYLASCGLSGCDRVNKTSLEWFKINEIGLVNTSSVCGYVGGCWGSDLLIANNNSWIVEIPPSIRPGSYVLRTEIIALHNASNVVGAQNYPQCINLEISGNGADFPAGVRGEKLYQPSDSGVNVNITKGVSSYVIPGPTPIKDARSVPLSHPVPTARATAIPDHASRQ